MILKSAMAAALTLGLSALGITAPDKTGGKLCFAADFEQDLSGWKPGPAAEAPVIDAGKFSHGGKALLFTVPTTISSVPIKVSPGQRYQLTLDCFSEAYGTFEVKVEEYNADGTPLTHPTANKTSEGLWEAKQQKRNFWFPMAIDFDTSAQCDHVKIIIRKWSNSKVWIDNVAVTQLERREIFKAEPLSPGNPTVYDRYSLALPGPDGLMYPNWTLAGAQDRTIKENNIIRLKDFGGIADDGKDDSDALEKACDQAGKSGGGIVLLGPGTYRLTRKFMITANHVIIRGTGRDKTRIEFGLPDNEVGVYPVTKGLFISPRTRIEVFFPAAGARKVTLSLDNQTIVTSADPKQFTALPDAPKFQMFAKSCGKFIKDKPDGRYLIKAEVEYDGGVKKTTVIPVVKDENGVIGGAYNHSVISFLGPKFGDAVDVTSDSHRGDRTITVANASGLKPGDFISINLKETERWYRLIHNNCTAWGEFRQFITVIEKIEGNRLTLLQPLRIDYPLVDKPKIRKFNPVRGSAIENLTITQLGEIQKELKIGTVIFSAAADCRAENINIENPGTQAVFGTMVKCCEIRNCRFRNPWRTKRGGLAYTGWECAWDCLIEKVETFRMRHAPLLNWTCSGNVIRDSVFHESDAQWHCGWCRDNLYEQCTIESTTTAYNGYGYGFFSTPVDDAMHGPNGPRNVIYNCRSVSLRDGFHLGGMNQQWMLMYNTITVDNGAGIVSRFGCSDNIIQGNVFILKNPAFPMAYYEFLDNTGDRLIGNTVYGGNGKLSAGPGKPETVKDNHFLPLTANPAAAKPPVPSIYLWQMQHYGSTSGKK